MRKFFVVAIFWTAIAQVSCVPSWNDLHYEGKLISGQFPSGQVVGNRELFQIYFEARGKKVKAVRFKSLRGEVLFEFSISEMKSKSFQLHLPFLDRSFKLRERKLPIKAFSASKCYEHFSDFSISTCFGANNFYFAIRDESGSVVLEALGGVFERAKFAYEAERDYTLTEAVDRAMKKNFQSLIEYEHMVQANQIALAANLNLLPHFRYFNAVGIALMAPPVLLVSLGDWFPFLFPSRWMVAAKAKAEARAEEIAFAIMQANIAAEVHSLSFSMIHDARRLEILSSIRQEAVRGITLAKELYDRSLIEIHAVNALNGFIEMLDIPINFAESAIGNDRAALSGALGYLNPHAIKSISKDINSPGIETGVLLNPVPITQLAYSVSLERKQLFYLKQALQSKKLENSFNWLDPTGNPQTALGFNLIPQVRAIESEVRVLHLEESRLEQKINQTAEAFVRQNNGVLVGYREALEAYTLSRSRLSSLWDSVNVQGKSQALLELYLFEIVQAYKDTLQMSLILEDYEEKWDKSHAGFQRLLFTDLYRQIADRASQDPPQDPSNANAPCKDLP